MTASMKSRLPEASAAKAASMATISKLLVTISTVRLL
jgi:hypothetical protein